MQLARIFKVHIFKIYSEREILFFLIKVFSKQSSLSKNSYLKKQFKKLMLCRAQVTNSLPFHFPLFCFKFFQHFLHRSLGFAQRWHSERLKQDKIFLYV